MNTPEYLITQERFDELAKEAEDRKSTVRMRISEALQAARELGDLKENAEYHDLRDQQGKNESRIQEIEAVLKHATIVTKGDSSSVTLASTVTIQKKDTDIVRTYTVVGPQEADMGQGKLSSESPIGKALLGKAKGDLVEIETPKGITTYVILEID